MKYFYSHLIEIEETVAKLDQLGLSEAEKLHLTQFLDSSLHHKILDAILSELSDQDKRIFIHHVLEGDHDKIWKFLNQKIDKVADKIKKAAEDLKKELHQDLREAHKLK